MNQIPDNQGLIMSWAFDEGTGTSTMESVSQDRNDIQYVFNQAEFTEPCDPQWRQGVLGSGLLFDGYSTSIAHSFKKEGDSKREPEYRSALSIGVWVCLLYTSPSPRDS